MRAASSGIFPSKGYHGEEFDQKSNRYSWRGQEMAKGWRPHFSKSYVENSKHVQV